MNRLPLIKPKVRSKSEFAESVLQPHSENNNDSFYKEIINFIIDNKPNKDEIAKKKVVLCRFHKLRKIPTDIEILLNAEEKDLKFLRKFLSTKPVRTGSGVAVIAIMTYPFKCPHGKCTYCPGGPGSFFGDVPQSYTGHEPATLRAIRNNYDAYLQVMNRLEQYIAIGQNPDKVELIIMGGTFPSYEHEYKETFVRDAFQAMNDFSAKFFRQKKNGLDDFDIESFKDYFMLPGNISDKERTKKIQEKLLELKKASSKNIVEVQEENEISRIRCIGLTIETKPDWGLLEQGNELLKLGCTRVELGVQTIYDKILKNTHRGHNLQDTLNSIRILKDLGFKLNFHMMPGLPGATKKMDLDCFKELFENPAYRPDMLKIYPAMVMPGTKLYLDYKAGKYAPLSTEEAANLIARAMKYIPRYCRIMRIQRDIPTKYSKGGIDKNNLRQMVEEITRKNKTRIQDIRAREIGNRQFSDPVDFEIIEYESSNGREAFISLKDSKDYLLGFLRLRFIGSSLRKETKGNVAIIRELHVYGKAIAIGEEEGNAQHKGMGKRLMAKAEQISKDRAIKKLLVISGVGVREYYKKLGYVKEGPYMAKLL